MSGAGLRAGRGFAVPAWVVVLLAVAMPGVTRPYTVEDLVHQESFGQVSFDPTGRWLAYERRSPRTEAPNSVSQNRHEMFENRVRLVDLSAKRVTAPLLADDPIGVTLGPFSPDGRRVALYGLRRGRWQLGVVVLATRRVRWLDVDPELPFQTRTVQWRNATQLVAIARPRGTLPLALKFNDEGLRELPIRWAATHRGETSVQAIGAGRYLSLRPRKAPSRLVLADVVSGRITRLVRGDIEDIEVAPDGRHVAFAEAGEDVRLVADQPVHGPGGGGWRHERLGLVELARGRIVYPCPGEDFTRGLLSWSPSGRRLLAFVNPRGAPLSAGRLVTVSAEGRAETLPLGYDRAADGARPDTPRAVWLGEVPAVRVEREGRWDWIAVADGAPRVLTAGLASVPDTLQPVRDAAIGVAQGRAWRFTPGGAWPLAARGGVRRLTNRLQWETRLGSNPPVQVETLPLQVNASGFSRALSMGRAGPAFDVAMAENQARVVASAPDGRTFAAISQDDHGVGRLQLSDGPRWRLLDTVNGRQEDVDHFRAVAVRQPGQAADGGALVAWLYRPALAAGGAPPPLIVVPYPGQRHTAPAAMADAGAASPSIPLLVGAGYAVLAPSLPMADGAEPAAGLGARVVDIVDAAAAQQPAAFDPRRLALWGHSFGGYGTVAILEQTDRFRAAVEMAGPVDLISLWGTFQAPERVDPSEGTGISGETGWTEDTQGAMQAPPWRDPGRYVRNSLIFHADHIHTPLLILEGDQDHIPLTQGEEIFSALYRQDRDAVLATYWGESHILYSPGNVRDAYRRGLSWLKENLDRPISVAAAPARSPAPGFANSGPSSR